MASVSKGQLVDAISEKAGVSKTAAAVLRSALDVIVESVANGDRVSLVGFGTFDSKERAAREGATRRRARRCSSPVRATPRRLAPAACRLTAAATTARAACAPLDLQPRGTARIAASPPRPTRRAPVTIGTRL